jgi:hypothetical protein
MTRDQLLGTFVPNASFEFEHYYTLFDWILMVMMYNKLLLAYLLSKFCVELNKDPKAIEAFPEVLVDIIILYFINLSR